MGSESKELRNLEQRLHEIRQARTVLDLAIFEAEQALAEVLHTKEEPGSEFSGSPSFASLELSDTKIPYLEAGVRLLAEAYGFRYLDGQRGAAMHNAALEDELLPFITPTRVCDLAGAKSASTFYSLWPRESGGRLAYLLELLVFVFDRPGTVEPGWKTEPAIPEYLAQALSEGRVTAAVHAFAAHNLNRMLLGDPLWYLHLHLSAVLQHHSEAGEIVRRCLARVYEQALEHYVPEYTEFLSGAGLRPRQGISIEDLADILWALSQGFALLHTTRGDRPEKTRNLFGVSIFGVIASLLVPTGMQGEPPIEEYAARELEQRFRRAESS
jgi:hypothetical protein